MSLYQYLVRLESILGTREDIVVELLKIDIFTIGVKFTSKLRFHDGSYLSIAEELEAIDQRSFDRRYYKFHYQDEKDNLIFRYDNAPHRGITKSCGLVNEKKRRILQGDKTKTGKDRKENTPWKIVSHPQQKSKLYKQKHSSHWTN